jgi:hypothetical protein
MPGFRTRMGWEALHREVKASLACCRQATAGAGGGGTDHGQDSEASSLFLPSEFFFC